MNALRFLSSWLLLVLILQHLASGQARAVEFLAATWMPERDRAALVQVPEGTKRLRLQTRKAAHTAWELAGIVHLEGTAGTLKLRLPDGVALENVLLETSQNDPFPYSYYRGQTSFSSAAASNGGLAPGVAFRNDALEDAGVGGTTTTTVEESDIWKWRGRTLYYFNSLRGLQVFDLADFAHPRRVASVRMPAVGEDMYLLGTEHVALLANRYNYSWNGSAGRKSEVVIFRHAGDQITETARVPIDGNFLESRLIGSTLCVVMQKTETVTVKGEVSYVSKTMVHAVDLADPSKPQLRGPLDITGPDGTWSWQAVVHATPEFLFVSTDSWNAGANARSSLSVIDLRTPEKPLAVAARFPLRGQLLTKFQLSLTDGVLTTVSQNNGAVVEIWDLNAALADSAKPTPLDSVLVGQNERLFGTRFDGSRVYVVTFRQIDPLFCVDLANPHDLKVLGELEVPGFSTYLESFTEGTRLLSVGLESGRVAVSLFDVNDPAQPTMKSRIRFGDENHWSWSEANYDEKAIGFFRAEGLLVLPMTEWTTQHGYRTGMQLADATADGLKPRGFINHRFSARRGRLFEQTLVSIGSTDLQVYNLADRDTPRQISSLTISWPVEQVLPYGDSLIQLESGDSYAHGQPGRHARLRLSLKADLDSPSADLDLGHPGELAGTTVRGDLLHVLLRTTESRIWDLPNLPVMNHIPVQWFTRLTALTVRLTGEGAPKVEGSASNDSGTAASGGDRMSAHELPDGRLLWYPSQPTSNYWFRGGPLDAVIGGAMVADVADFGFGRGWWGGLSELLTVDISEPAKPKILTRQYLLPDSAQGSRTGRALLSADNRLLISWTESRQDGAMWKEDSFVQEIDFSDPAAITRSQKVNVPAPVQGLHRTTAGGTILFTSRDEVLTGPDNSITYTSNLLVDALAYDGTQAFLLHTGKAEGSSGMPVVSSGLNLFVSRQQWLSTDQTKGALHVLRLDEPDGKLIALPDIAIGPGWPTLEQRGGFLFAFGSGQTQVIATHQLPAVPAQVTLASDVTVWQATDVVLDPLLPLAWHSLGAYGVEKLDLSSLPVPPPSTARSQRDVTSKWHPVTLMASDVVATKGTHAGGPLDATADFRFSADGAAESFEQWQSRFFKPGSSGSAAYHDSDADGFDNYSEWAFGTSPQDSGARPQAASGLVRLDPAGTPRLALIADVNPLAVTDDSGSNSYLELSPEMSTDLTTWRNVLQNEVEIIRSGGRRIYVLPASTPGLPAFGRLRMQFPSDPLSPRSRQ